MLGVNLSGAEFGSGGAKYGYDYFFPSAKDLAFYAAKGITTVRLPVKWERLQPTLGGALDATELSRLNAFLDKAQAAGVQVIVDVHNFGTYDGAVIGSAKTPVASFADFWSKLAGAIGDKPAVLGYDIMNEPHGMPTKTTWPDAAQAATDAIRAIGDTHTIFVEGEHWAGAAAWAQNNPNLDVKDSLDKIVYEAHVYFDKDGSGTYKGSYDEEGAYADIGEKRLKSFVGWLQQHDAKGFIGEFSVPSDDPRWQTVLSNFLTAMEKNGLSGTYWGAGSGFNGYAEGLLTKAGTATASLGTLLSHVVSSADIPITMTQAATTLTGTADDDNLAGTATAAVYDGRNGTDTVDFSTLRTGVTADLGSDTQHYLSIENLTGGRGDDVLTGNATTNVLAGGAGEDRLDGGAGADRLVGGDGGDHYWVDNAGDRVVERLGEGADTVHASIDWTLGDFVENLELSGAAVLGTGNALANVITGDALANVLTGLGGDDTLDGGAGADVLVGGLGDDIYIVDDAHDTVTELSGQGTDTVRASVDWTLSTSVETLVLTGGASIDGTGNAAVNTITGNDAANGLWGLAGDDALSGAGGDDRIDGGAGADTIDGGAGDDVIFGRGGRDWLTGGAGRDVFAYVGASDSTVAMPDRITDFTLGQDRIDLSRIDANTRAAADQGFTFIGNAAFGGHAGELRYEVRDGYEVIQADRNGDGTADFAIRLQDFTKALHASDFVL